MIKRSFRSFLNKLGFDVIKSSKSIPVRVQDNTFHPVQGDFLRGKQDVVIDVEMSEGLGLPLWSYGANSLHPFVVALKKGNGDFKVVRSILKLYFENVCPHNAADILGDGLRPDSEFHNLSPSSAVMPWSRFLPFEWSERLRSNLEKENSRINRRFAGVSGLTWVGPVSEEKLNLEVDRVMTLYNSIRTRGYQRSDRQDGDVCADILVDDNFTWKWISTTGQHRAAILSSLGIERIPVRIGNVIRRSELKYAPLVISNVYSLKEAERVFDNVFLQKESRLTMNWKDVLKENEWSLKE
jgi:hypothetical protein